MLFKDRLKQLRKKKKMTQEALAEASGIPLNTLRGYEQDQRFPGFPAIVKLAKALGVSCDQFSDCDDVKGD